MGRNPDGTAVVRSAHIRWLVRPGSDSRRYQTVAHHRPRLNYPRTRSSSIAFNHLVRVDDNWAIPVTFVLTLLKNEFPTDQSSEPLRMRSCGSSLVEVPLIAPSATTTTTWWSTPSKNKSPCCIIFSMSCFSGSHCRRHRASGNPHDRWRTTQRHAYHVTPIWVNEPTRGFEQGSQGPGQSSPAAVAKLKSPSKRCVTFTPARYAVEPRWCVTVSLHPRRVGAGYDDCR